VDFEEPLLDHLAVANDAIERSHLLVTVVGLDGILVHFVNEVLLVLEQIRELSHNQNHNRLFSAA